MRQDKDAAEIQAALDAKKKTEVHLDQIRGSLFGGAVGDALGYAVEFCREGEIFSRFGEKGITEYVFDRVSGKALISDDTQMALFTANGLLFGETRAAMRGIGSSPRTYVEMAYQDWLKTQENTYKNVQKYNRYTKEGGYSWLLDVPELYSRRAPGNTCLSALLNPKEEIEDYVANPANHSKGCGGVMRVAPLALKYIPGENFYGDRKALDMEGAQICAITHGHSLGYMPGAVLTHIISRLLTSKDEMSFKEIVIEARDTVSELFAGDEHIDELKKIIDLAISLSENTDSDLNNIHQLGEGWVAEETLAIALYCALKYQDDFSAGMIAAVNHNGDSDSTGAVTGNLLGALVGYERIEDKWKNNLELEDIILEMADDLCHGCQMNEYSHYEDLEWMCKYMDLHRYTKKK